MKLGQRGNSQGVLMIILLVVALIGAILFFPEFVNAFRGEEYNVNNLVAGVVLIGMGIVGEGALIK